MKTHEFIRVLLHIICGLAIGYDITFLTDFNEYSIIDKIIGVLGCMTVVGIVAAGFWEYGQIVLFKAKFSIKDIITTTASVIVGSTLALFIQSDIIFNILLVLSGGIVIHEILTYYKLLSR